jgi:hypothetical protein
MAETNEKKPKTETSAVKIKKVTEAEMIIWGLPILCIEIICAFLDALSIGALLIFSATLKTGIKIWFDMFMKRKGDKSTGLLKDQLAKWLGNAFPLGTFIMFVITVIKHNHPKLAQFAGKAAGQAVGGPAGAKIGGAAMSQF